ncbi:MAG: hypothetical protein FWG45_02880 [Oscillospiraceae bacterium]|nr:hypothetical protein [Oscillospiraceae bacterium]
MRKLSALLLAAVMLAITVPTVAVSADAPAVTEPVTDTQPGEMPSGATTDIVLVKCETTGVTEVWLNRDFEYDDMLVFGFYVVGGEITSIRGSIESIMVNGFSVKICTKSHWGVTATNIDGEVTIGFGGTENMEKGDMLGFFEGTSRSYTMTEVETYPAGLTVSTYVRPKCECKKCKYCNYLYYISYDEPDEPDEEPQPPIPTDTRPGEMPIGATTDLVLVKCELTGVTEVWLNKPLVYDFPKREMGFGLVFRVNDGQPVAMERSGTLLNVKSTVVQIGEEILGGEVTSVAGEKAVVVGIANNENLKAGMMLGFFPDVSADYLLMSRETTPSKLTATTYVRQCLNCDGCGYQGGIYGFGRVTDSGDVPQMADALAILRFVVKLSSPLDTDINAVAAASITSPGNTPQMADALAVLRFMVKLSSPLDKYYK